MYTYVLRMDETGKPKSSPTLVLSSAYFVF